MAGVRGRPAADMFDVEERQAGAPRADYIEVVAVVSSSGTFRQVRQPVACRHTVLVVVEVEPGSPGDHHCCARRSGARTGGAADDSGTGFAHDR